METKVKAESYVERWQKEQMMKEKAGEMQDEQNGGREGQKETKAKRGRRNLETSEGNNR